MEAGERTEQATPRRRQDAREKGQVAKSIEVNAAVGLLAAVLAWKMLGGGMATTWQRLLVEHIHEAGVTDHLTTTMVQKVTATSIMEFFQLVLPILLVSMVAGVAANVLQTGFLLVPNTLAPDMQRLNPLQGLARIFSSRTAIELVKSGVKAALVGYVIYGFFRQQAPVILMITRQDPLLIAPTLGRLALELLLRTSLVLAIIAVADYAFQRWQFEKTLRMTKEEVKEEYKRTEGDPLIKSRTRQRQRQIARQRMMADVPTATVVVTNPTHLAVALRYEAGMTAPIVVAKGQRYIAEKIKAVAREHGVPVVENKPLARALFAQCDIGAMIPVEFYRTVAEVLAFVYAQSGHRTEMLTRKVTTG